MNTRSVLQNVITLFLLMTTFSFSQELEEKMCTKGFYAEKNFFEAEKTCIDEHKGTYLDFNNGNCTCSIQGSNTTCSENSKYPGKSASDARRLCEEKFGILYNQGGNCECQVYGKGKTCQYEDNLSEPVYNAYLKCTNSGGHRFQYKNNECVCENKNCTYEVKEFYAVAPNCNTYNSGIIDKDKQRAFQAQIKEMEEAICDEINKKIDTSALRKLIENNPECSHLKKQLSQFSDKNEMEVTFSLGEGEKEIECETKVSTSNGQFDIDNIGDSFPNNIITLEATEDNYSIPASGSVSIKDTEVASFRKSADGKIRSISRKRFEVMTATYQKLRSTFKGKIEETIKVLQKFSEDSGKPIEIAAEELFNSLVIKLEVYSFASLLNTNTFNNYSNQELAAKRYERTVAMIRKLIKEELEIQLGEISPDLLSLINVEQQVVLVQSQFGNHGTFGAMVPTTNAKGFKKVFKNAQEKENKFLDCSIDSSSNEAFKQNAFECSLKYFLAYQCPILSNEMVQSVFPECLERNKFVYSIDNQLSIDNEKFQETLNDPLSRLNKLANSFKQGEKNDFLKYKYFAVKGEMSYLLQSSKTVRKVAKKSETVTNLNCAIPLPAQEFPEVHHMKTGYKAHINYADNYACQESILTVESKSFRFLKFPDNWLNRELFSNQCKETEQKAKEHYKNQFGSYWKDHWKADYKNYKTLGGDHATRAKNFDDINTSDEGIHFVYNKSFNTNQKFADIEMRDQYKTFYNIPHKTVSLKLRGEALEGEPEISIALDGVTLDKRYTVRNVNFPKGKDRAFNGAISMIELDESGEGVIEICYLEDHFTMSGGKLSGKRRLFYEQTYIDENNEKVTIEGEIIEGLSLYDNSSDDNLKRGDRSKACRVFLYDTNRR
ncbi:hypothetical protein N9N67_11150 [Bacteriovoracaceae bacterium]|nr:hypothetical protein [Bacteriovoracaceae bacterium]